MGGLESSAVAEGVGGFVVLSIAWGFQSISSKEDRIALSSPEVRAGCRPSAPAVLTCPGRAALVSPTQPGVRC